MRRNCCSSQVVDLLHSLAAIPGSIELRLRARQFARLGPADPGSSYQERIDSFRPDHLPDSVDLPPDPDEIAVTVEGSLPDGTAADPIIDDLDDFVHAHLGAEWDLRAHVPGCESSQRGFTFTVFMNHLAASASFHAPAD